MLTIRRQLARNASQSTRQSESDPAPFAILSGLAKLAKLVPRLAAVGIGPIARGRHIAKRTGRRQHKRAENHSVLLSTYVHTESSGSGHILRILLAVGENHKSVTLRAAVTR